MGESYTVYKHTAPNGKCYVGITCRPVSKRWGNGSGYKSSTVFRSAIEKYGWENIKHEIITAGLTKKEAEQLEIQLIADGNLTDRRFGYNVENGGKSVGRFTEETKRKISNSKTGVPLKGDAYRRICEMNKSEKHKEAAAAAARKRTGTHLKRETVEKIKSTKLENGTFGKRCVCVETGEVFESYNQAAKRVGVSRSCIIDACTGKTATSAGYHWCLEKDLDKFSPAVGVRPVTRRVTNLDTGEVFNSLTEAALSIGKLPASVCAALRGRCKTSGGYHWAYTDGEWKVEGGD